MGGCWIFLPAPILDKLIYGQAPGQGKMIHFWEESKTPWMKISGFSPGTGGPDKDIPHGHAYRVARVFVERACHRIKFDPVRMAGLCFFVVPKGVRVLVLPFFLFGVTETQVLDARASEIEEFSREMSPGVWDCL